MNEITLRHEFAAAGASHPYRVTGPALIVQTDGVAATLQGSNFPETEASWQAMGNCTGYTPLTVTTPFAFVRVVAAGAGVVAVSGASAPAAGAAGGGSTSDATAANQVTEIARLTTIVSQTDGIEGSLQSIDQKMPVLSGGKVPISDYDGTQMLTNVAARIGATDDAPPASDTAASSLIGLVKRVLQRLTMLITGGQPMAQIIDEATAGTTYICEAPIGTATSAAAWRVQRIVDSNGVKTIRWAGTAAFDQVADSRTGLTYN